MRVALIIVCLCVLGLSVMAGTRAYLEYRVARQWQLLWKDCPTEWKCNGSSATNDPNCTCWDKR